MSPAPAVSQPDVPLGAIPTSRIEAGHVTLALQTVTKWIQAVSRWGPQERKIQPGPSSLRCPAGSRGAASTARQKFLTLECLAAWLLDLFERTNCVRSISPIIFHFSILALYGLCRECLYACSSLLLAVSQWLSTCQHISSAVVASRAGSSQGISRYQQPRDVTDWSWLQEGSRGSSHSARSKPNHSRRSRVLAVAGTVQIGGCREGGHIAETYTKV